MGQELTQTRSELSRLEQAFADFVEADLLADEGWDEALRGVDGVLHLASPFPLAQPEHVAARAAPAARASHPPD